MNDHNPPELTDEELDAGLLATPAGWHIYTLTRSTEGMEALTPVAVIGWQGDPAGLDDPGIQLQWMTPGEDEAYWFDSWYRKLEAASRFSLPPLTAIDTVLEDNHDLDRLPYRMFQPFQTFQEAFDDAVAKAQAFPQEWAEIMAKARRNAEADRNTIPASIAAGQDAGEQVPQAVSKQRCSRCGAPGAWLVTVPHANGRLLLNCADCREREDPGGVVIPLELVNASPDTVLGFLYEHRYTVSDPQMAANVTGLPEGPWVAIAQAAINSSR